MPLLGHYSPSVAPSRRPSVASSSHQQPAQETLFSRFKRRQSASSDAYDGGGGYRRGSHQENQEDEHGSTSHGLNGRSQSTGRLFQLPQFFSWHPSPHEGGGGGGGGGSSMALMTMTGGSMTGGAGGESQGSPSGGVGGMGEREREDDMSWAGSASAASSATAKRRQEKKALSATNNNAIVTSPLPAAAAGNGSASGSGSPTPIIIASSSRSNNNANSNSNSGSGRGGGSSSPILRRGSSGMGSSMMGGGNTPTIPGPPSSSSPTASYHPTQSIAQQSLGQQSHQSLFQADIFPQGLMMEIYAIYAMELPSVHRLAANSPICAVACGRFTSSTDERKGSGSMATWEDLSMRFLFEKKSNLRLLFLSKDLTIGFCTLHREKLLNGKASQAGRMMVLGDILDSKNRSAGKVKVIYSIEIP